MDDRSEIVEMTAVEGCMGLAAGRHNCRYQSLQRQIIYLKRGI
jgi:hypothetical protein